MVAMSRCRVRLLRDSAQSIAQGNLSENVRIIFPTEKIEEIKSIIA
jgi:hypothetical protein